MKSYRVDDSNGKCTYIEAQSQAEAIQMVLKEQWKYSNWSILKDDHTYIYRPDKKGEYYLAAILDMNSKTIYAEYEVGHWSSEEY